MVGISSAEQIYRLAWMLNLGFQWKLRKVEDIQCTQRYGISYHDCYIHRSEDAMLVIHLIDNRTPEGNLISEMATFDYLLKIVDHNDLIEDVFYKRLKRLPLVMAIMEMDMVKMQKSANIRYLEVLG